MPLIGIDVIVLGKPLAETIQIATGTPTVCLGPLCNGYRLGYRIGEGDDALEDSIQLPKLLELIEGGHDTAATVYIEDFIRKIKHAIDADKEDAE